MQPTNTTNSLTHKPQAAKDNKRAYLLSGVFGVLMIILVVMVVASLTPQPPAHPVVPPTPAPVIQRNAQSSPSANLAPSTTPPTSQPAK